MAKTTKKADTENPVSGNPDASTRERIKITIELKKKRILELTEMGASIQQISDRLKGEGWTGVSRSNVGKHLKNAVDECIAENKLKTRHIVELEIRKERRKELAIVPNYLRLLDEDAKAIKETGKSKNAHAIEKYSQALGKVTSRVDALLGLNKPQQVEHTGEGGGPIETVVTTRVILPTIAEIPNDEE